MLHPLETRRGVEFMERLPSVLSDIADELHEKNVLQKEQNELLKKQNELLEELLKRQ